MNMHMSKLSLIEQGYKDVDADRIMQRFVDDTITCKDMKNLRVTVLRGSNGVIKAAQRSVIK